MPPLPGPSGLSFTARYEVSTVAATVFRPAETGKPVKPWLCPAKGSLPGLQLCKSHRLSERLSRPDGPEAVLLGGHGVSTFGRQEPQIVTLPDPGRLLPKILSKYFLKPPQ